MLSVASVETWINLSCDVAGCPRTMSMGVSYRPADDYGITYIDDGNARISLDMARKIRDLHGWTVAPHADRRRAYCPDHEPSVAGTREDLTDDQLETLRRKFVGEAKAGAPENAILFDRLAAEVRRHRAIIAEMRSALADGVGGTSFAVAYEGGRHALLQDLLLLLEGR
jgi:hypothetical protein